MKTEIPGYQIIRELGKGGMATVYLAIQESFGREVALKVMAPSLSADPDFHERFLREAQIVSRLVHPHIVTVYDVGERDGHHYLSMEYVKGQDLRNRRDSLPLLERLRIIREVARALDYASKKGYIHRDVKPDNIMLREDDGRAVLMDFGIARTVEADMSMTQTGTVIGTPQYMSPEQARGRKADHRADLYSLGVVLFQLLAGRVPYHAETPVAVALKHITEPVPKLPPKLRVFQPVIDKALAKEPGDRFQSGAEMVAALDAISQAYERAMQARKSEKARNGDAPAVAPELRSTPAGPAPTGPESLHVPQEYRRRHEAQPKNSRWGVWVLLLVLIGGGGGAAYYNGWLDSLIEQRSKSAAVLSQEPPPPAAPETQSDQSPAGDSPPAEVAAEAAAAPETPPAAISLEPAEAPDEEVASAEPAPPPILDKTSEPEIGKGNGLRTLMPDVSTLIEAKPSLHAKIREQAEALESRIEDDSSVIPRLAQLYLLVLSDKPDDSWAVEGLQRLQSRHLQRAQALLEAGDRERARQSLEVAVNNYPDDRRDPGFETLAENLARADRIQGHLEAARRYLDDNALTSPEGANALESYRAVLAEVPDHGGARAGISQIAARYEVLAQSHLQKGDYRLALEMVKRGLGVAPEHGALLDLKSRISNRLVRVRQIEDLLQQGRTLQVAGKLIQPAGKCAFDAYQRVLTLEAGNTAAREGLQAIESELRLQVQRALDNDQLKAAGAVLAEARERFPKSGVLLELQARLDDEMEAVARAAREASRPKVAMLRVSGFKLASLDADQSPAFNVDRTLHIGFRYRNFQADTTVMQAVLYDGARSLEIAQVPVIVSGSEGSKFFQIDRPVEGFPEGGYNLDLVLEGKRMVTTRFKVEK